MLQQRNITAILSHAAGQSGASKLPAIDPMLSDLIIISICLE
jgi:hypothetical protein